MSNLTITEFLEARIAEDETVVYNVMPADVETFYDGHWVNGPTSSERLLAECAAKRAIIEEHVDAGGSQGYVDGGYGWLDHACSACGTSGEYGEPWPCKTVRALAAICADHEDYRQEWKL